MILETLHLRGAIGAMRREQYDGREHIVVPAVALIAGQVIHAVNSQHPERIPYETLVKSAASFNGRPVVFGHPTRNGVQVSANDPAILAKFGIGTIFNSRMDGQKLLMDCFIDPIKAKNIGGEQFLAQLETANDCDVSVGAFVVTDNVSGDLNGKHYNASWIDTTGDHLAALPNGRGACDGSMGCGLHKAAEMYLVTAEGLEAVNEAPKSIKEQVIAFLSKLIGAKDSSQTADIAIAVDEFLAAKAKMEDCTACNGAGNVDGNPCEACDGNGEMKAAAGARHSGNDQQMIQTVHDHAVDLGAKCARDYKIAEVKTDPSIIIENNTVTNLDEVDPSIVIRNNTIVDTNIQLKAACRCEEDNVTKTERIEELLKNEYNPLKDQKALEAATDKAIDALEAHVESLRVAAEKTAADVQAAADAKVASEKLVTEANDKVLAAEAKLKAAAEHVPTEEEYLKTAPESIRTLVAEKKAQDAAQKTELVTALKIAAAGVFSDEELNAKSISELLKLAQMAKLDTPKPDYSGRAVPRVANDVSYEAPDPYEAGIKALQNSVN